MAIKMIAPFKDLKIDQLVTPEDGLADWLVSRKYAVRVKEEPKKSARGGARKKVSSKGKVKK